MIVPDVTMGFVRAAEKERRGMLGSAPAIPEMKITTEFLKGSPKMHFQIVDIHNC